MTFATSPLSRSSDVAQGLASPDWWAIITSCARSRAPSLANRWLTCVFTMEWLTNSSSAICRFKSPRATATSTSTSRSVRAGSDNRLWRLASATTNCSISLRVAGSRARAGDELEGGGGDGSLEIFSQVSAS